MTVSCFISACMLISVSVPEWISVISNIQFLLILMSKIMLLNSIQQDKLEIISRNSLLDFYKIEKSFIHLCSIQ
jgi:hypothetical protein